MQLNLDTLTPQNFLQQYWQQKPLVIRKGLPDFKDLLSPDELAGLATDERVESRLIYQEDGKWQADFGPFDSYDHLGDTDWSLVVQALNHWVPECDQLIHCFDFIPRWRFDDVMTSFATPGGGVGPHIDLYDTFICQGSGRRRWRVGARGPHKEFPSHPALLHTEAFQAIIDVELQSGDILYVPPGFPHEGVALENSMSFSVGYRSASARDMHNALADHLIDHDLAKQQIEDPGRIAGKHSGKIDKQDFSRIKHQMLALMNDELIRQFSGCFLTQSKCELDVPEEPLDFDADYVLEIFKQQPLIRLGGLRCLYFEDTAHQGIFYLNGEEINLPEQFALTIPILCDQTILDYDILAQYLSDDRFVEQLTVWLNKGYWYFEAD